MAGTAQAQAAAGLLLLKLRGWFASRGNSLCRLMLRSSSSPHCHSPNPRLSQVPAQSRPSPGSPTADPGPGSPAWLPQPSAPSLTHRETHSSGISRGLAGHFGCFLHGIKQLSGLSVNIIWRNNTKRDI